MAVVDLDRRRPVAITVAAFAQPVDRRLDFTRNHPMGHCCYCRLKPPIFRKAPDGILPLLPLEFFRQYWQ